MRTYQGGADGLLKRTWMPTNMSAKAVFPQYVVKTKLEQKNQKYE